MCKLVWVLVYIYEHMDNITSATRAGKRWTEEELDMVRSRYPIEGAVLLAKDLGRTEPSVRMCATQHGLNVDHSVYKRFSTGRRGCLAGTFRGYGKVFGTYVKALTRRGWSCDVTAEYLDSITTDRCPLSGRALTYPAFSGDVSANASVDRIDSTKGYIVGNVQWVDKHVNIMKRDKTERELFEYAKDIVDTLSKRYQQP